jgi:hypothetical protein
MLGGACAMLPRPGKRQSHQHPQHSPHSPHAACQIWPV